MTEDKTLGLLIYHIVFVDEDIFEEIEEKGIVTGTSYIDAINNLNSWYGENNISVIKHLEFITDAPILSLENEVYDEIKEAAKHM